VQIWKQFSRDALGPRVTEMRARDRERMFFLMYQMLKCGQTTESAVRAVAKSFRSEGKEDISAALHAIAQKVAQGKPMSKSMEMEYVMFDDVHRAAVMAGEASNYMTESFHILQVLEDKKIAASRAGMAELLTPMLMLCFSLFSIFNTGLNTLPVLTQLKTAQGKSLGVAPRLVMDMTGWCAEHWHVLLAIAITLSISAYAGIKSTQGRFWLDYYTLRVPLMGKFIRYTTYANMLLYFPHLVESGVKPKQMIPIMEAMSTNIVLRRKIDAFNQVITTGGKMSDAMEKAGFPGLIVTPIRVSENYAGSDTGTNDVMIEGMNHAYSILERDLTDTHKRFIGTFSVILWLMGGGVMLLEMMSIVLAQS
jgi:type II secretory pathway component PulF